MKKILIMTHSLMAKGIKETIEFLAGEQNIDVACCFTDISNPDEFIDNYLSKINNDKLIIFTDLMGGSVNQKVALRLNNNNFYLITGVNLPLILELALLDEELITEEKIEEIIQNAKNEIIFVNKALKNNTESEEDFF